MRIRRLFPLVYLLYLIPVIIAQDTPSNLVVAHFMVGNTYPYTVDDWTQDFQLAASKGIDAFALNIGRDPWEPDRIADAFKAMAMIMALDPVAETTTTAAAATTTDRTSTTQLAPTTTTSSTTITTTTDAILLPPTITTTAPAITILVASPTPLGAACPRKRFVTRRHPATSEGGGTLLPSASVLPRALCARRSNSSATTIPPSFNATSNTTFYPRTPLLPPPSFRLFLSFDMSSLPCGSPSDADTIRSLIRTYAMHPAYLLFQGRPLVSTFGGEYCNFGTGSLDAGWVSVVRNGVLNGVGGPMDGKEVAFLPAFFVDPGVVGGLAVDGAFSWNSAWPMGNYPIDTQGTDAMYLGNLTGKIYMAGVSPWFFTHYGPSTYNKNWIYRSEGHLLARRFESLIANRARIPIAQIITWNDYGESHYIGPVKGAQPGSQAWVDGFDHQGWLDVIQHYIYAFKYGVYPNIEKDRLFIWGRLFPANADAPSDPVGRPDHHDWAIDRFEILLHLTAPADLSISCGPSNTGGSFPAGISKLSLDVSQNIMGESVSMTSVNITDTATVASTPTDVRSGTSSTGTNTTSTRKNAITNNAVAAIDSCQVTTLLMRNGQTVINYVPAGMQWRRQVEGGKGYNFNAFVGASPV